MDNIAHELWQKVLPHIQKDISPASFSSWIEPLVPISCEGDMFLIQAENNFLKTQAENYIPLINNVMLEVLSIRYNTEIIVKNVPVSDSQVVEKNTSSGQNVQPSNINLNPSYTFDNFVVGSSNTFAHAACVAVAQNPGGKQFNPLFLYGGSGLGKTHLLHAIGNFIMANSPEKKIIYVSCEQFLNEFIRTIKTDKYDQFRGKYRNCDILLIDDIQFIEKKEGVQVEFFSTFNTLFENGSNIVMTCDKPPKNLVCLEERLRTRFASGLMVDINTPDFETRYAILEQRAQITNSNVPEDVLEYIALNVTNSIRELEGALSTVVAYSYLAGNLNLEVAKEALKNIVTQDVSKKMSPETMLQMIARYFDFTEEELKSKNKNKNLATARQITMYIMVKNGNMTYEQIGQLLGGKHHSTIMHGYNKISEEIKNANPEITNAVSFLQKRIKGY